MHADDPLLMTAMLAALVFGASSVTYNILQMKKWKHVSDWPKVRGRIIKRSTEWRRVSMLTMVIRRYVPMVEFEYEFRGHRHVGRRITLQDKVLESESEENIAKYLASLPPDPEVFVNPMNPSEAYLDAFISESHRAQKVKYIVIGLVSLITSAFLFYLPYTSQ